MPDLSGDVFFLTIRELSAKLRAKEFSAVELTRAYCDRLEKIGSAHNALAHSLRDSAVKQAKDVDGDLKRGRTRGLLQGIPYGAKDLLAVKKQPTTWGSRMFADLKRVKAWVNLDGSHELGAGPRQSQENQEEAYPLSRCMTCGCCLEACPLLRVAGG